MRCYIQPVPGADTTKRQDGHLAVAISNLVVRVLRERTGRGPTKARAHVTEDLIAVILQDTLTTADRTLVATGKSEVLLATRRAFRDTMRAELVAGVEELTGRTVIAFFCDHSFDPDIALEFFLLEPRTADQRAAAAA